MAQGRQKREFSIKRVAAAEPMSQADLAEAVDLLAEFAARAYAVDHPDQFGPHLARVLEERRNGKR